MGGLYPGILRTPSPLFGWDYRMSPVRGTGPESGGVQQEDTMRLTLIFISVVVFLAGCGPSLAPVPKNVYYVNPPDSIGEIGKFVGAWKGDWKRLVGHRLYVQEIMQSYAKVIVSTGWIAREGYFDIAEGYIETEGIFIGKDIFVTLEQDRMKMEITYRLNYDDTISAFGKFHVKGASKPYEIKTILHRDQNGK